MVFIYFGFIIIVVIIIFYLLRFKKPFCLLTLLFAENVFDLNRLLLETLEKVKYTRTENHWNSED